MAIHFDRARGFGWAGGYAGHGVVAANISGRTLADLVLGRDFDLVTLPWVGHRSRRWEPEPLRFVASRAIVRVLGSADRREDETGRRLAAHAPARARPAAALRCGREDSNLHGQGHRLLRPARLPVPPRPRVGEVSYAYAVAVAQLVVAPGCGPGGRGFESHRSPSHACLASRRPRP